MHHVLEGAGAVVVGGPSLKGEALEPADVHVVDVHRVEHRLEDAVEEAQDDDPAHELVGEEMVDAEDRGLGQLDADDLVEVVGRGQVGAEGLFDRHRVGGPQRRRRERRQRLGQQVGGQREVDQRVWMVVADQAADVLRPGDVGGLEAEHAHHAVACGRRHGRMLLQLAGDVLAEVVARPVGDVGSDDGQPRWQQLSFGQLGDRRQQQPTGQITGSSEQDHALDHRETPFSARPGRSA